jgi:hypothetical protein
MTQEGTEMTRSMQFPQSSAAGWAADIGSGANRSLRRIGSIVFGWLRGGTASQEADLDAARLAQAREYDARIIRRAVYVNSSEEVDWLLYASMITDPAKRRYCLERALAINPDSALASSALARLAGTPATFTSV